MNNKGFTLLELIATIIILSIVMLIAVPSITNLSTTVRKNDRENNIKNIEIAASKYAFDTGETLIFVDKLVTEGYIKGNEDGNVIDSLNNKRLNCYMVKMEKHNNSYDAKFLDGTSYEKDGSCDNAKLNDMSSGVNILVYENGLIKENSNDWLKGVIKLKASSDTLNIDCNENLCTWSSTQGANINGTDEVIINIPGNVLETRYNFQFRTLDSEKKIKDYNSSLNLKIDNEAPFIDINAIEITNEYVASDRKRVTITANDGRGSGISGYYLNLNNGTPCSTDLEYQEENEFTITKNGNYLLCVKDKVGNISSYDKINITTIVE